MMLNKPETKNCICVYWNLWGCSANVNVKVTPSHEELSTSHTAQFTNHIVTIKPTVPNTRIGGKSFTVSYPLFFNMVKAVVFAKAIVGI